MTLYTVTSKGSLVFQKIDVINIDSVIAKIKLPERECLLGINGNVIIKINLNSNGSISNLKILESYTKEVDQSIVRVLKNQQLIINDIEKVIDSDLIFIVSVNVRKKLQIKNVPPSVIIRNE